MNNLNRLAAAHEKRLFVLEHIGRAGFLTASQVGALISNSDNADNWRKLGQKLLNRLGYAHEPTNASQCRHLPLQRCFLGGKEDKTKRHILVYQLTEFGSRMLDQEKGILVRKSIDVRTDTDTWWHRMLSNWTLILEFKIKPKTQLWYEHEIACWKRPSGFLSLETLRKIPDGIIQVESHTTWVEIEASHKRSQERVKLIQFLDYSIRGNWQFGYDAVHFYALHKKLLTDLRSYLRKHLEFLNVDPVLHPGTKRGNINFFKISGEKRTGHCQQILFDETISLWSMEELSEARQLRFEHDKDNAE